MTPRNSGKRGSVEEAEVSKVVTFIVEIVWARQESNLRLSPGKPGYSTTELLALSGLPYGAPEDRPYTHH